MRYTKQSFQTFTNTQSTENNMNKFQSILALIVLAAFIKGLFALSNPQKPTGTVTVAHEDVEIVFVQDETLVLRAER